MDKMKHLPGLAVAFGLVFVAQVAVQQTEAPYLYIPSTVSQEAQEFIRVLPDPSLQPEMPAPDDVKAWKAAQQAREAHGFTRQKAVVDRLQPIVTEMELGGVPVLDIKPRNWKNNGKVMVYTPWWGLHLT
jgi:monoterpene epsilon-lactone hydrolase